MIIVRVPTRISLVGGGTDYPEFFNEYGGSVINTSINKYIYLMVRYLPPFFKYKYRIRYRFNEKVNNIEQIKHPTVRECIRFLNINKGIEIVHVSDLPAATGIGSSSSFAVALLHGLNTLQGNMISKRQLALDAIHVEQSLVKEMVGCQDQTAAAFGGFNRIDFNKDDIIKVSPIILPKNDLEEFQNNFIMFFTGFTRTSSDVANKYIPNLSKKKKRELILIKESVDTALDFINRKEFDKIGYLLDEMWQVKRGLSSVVSNKEIDNIYDIAKKNGALGGKITGAGGGGMMLLYVPKEKQEKVKQALRKLLFIPFRFEFNGSQVIFHNHQDNYDI